MMYDLIIIGAGPAGITAAVYAARKRMKTLVLTRNIGGQAAMSWDVENYTGYQFITGPELAKKFEEHLKSQQVESHEGVSVESIWKTGDSFKVMSSDGTYEARMVIIATGKQPNRLGVPGEKEFWNKGVTYCATCDAPIFEGKPVVVVGGGNSALDAAIQLAKIASRVSIVNIMPEFTGDPVMVEKVISSDRVTVYARSEINEILGQAFVTHVKVRTPEGIVEVPAEGVFIEIGSGPSLVPVMNAELKLNDKREIEVNENAETSVPGLFACGDVSSVPVKQIIVAAGQGCVACLSAFKYLSTRRF